MGTYYEQIDSEVRLERPDFYRYFLGIRPPPELYPAFQAIGHAAGQSVRVAMLHLTFCVIAESAERDRFIARRVRRILRDQLLHSFAVNLGMILAGPHGATARAVGRQDDIQEFYRMLVRLLRASGVEPLYRKSGLRPHITLGYDAFPVTRLGIGLNWFPTELLLIESEFRLTRHNVIGAWSLLPPRHALLPFGEPFSEQHVGGRLIAAADPARRSAA